MSPASRTLVVLHQTGMAHLLPPLGPADAVLVLERPATLSLGEAQVHGLDKGQDSRRDLYRSLMAALQDATGDSVSGGRLAQLVAPVLYKSQDLAGTLRLRDALAGEGGAPRLCLATDNPAGFARLRRLQRQLRAAGLEASLQVPPARAWRFGLREALAGHKEAAKQLARGLMLRWRLRKPATAGGEAIVFHATAARIWAPLLPLVKAASSRRGLDVVAAVSTKSVRGTPFGLSWDAIVSLDGTPAPARLRRSARRAVRDLLRNPGREGWEGLLLRGLAGDLSLAMEQRLAIGEGMRRLLSSYSRLCLVTADGFGVTTASLFGLGDSRVSFAMMPHGMFDPRWPEMECQPQPRFLLCWSEAMRASVAAKSSVQALLVGYHGDAAAGGAVQDHRKVLVAFGRPDTVLDIATFDRAVDAVEQAAREHPGLTFIVRKHPSDLSSYWPRRLAAMPGNVVFSSTPGLEDELDAVFLVLTMHSTVGMQAICRDRAVVTVRPAGADYADPPDYLSSGAAVLADNGAALSSEVARLARDWPADAQASARRLYAAGASAPVDLQQVLDRLLQQA